ncbi:hypothetical protein YSA_07567 [Pseudomonas putida ND6]|uniref:Uncharacterized protein n=1 Tax=Pseudomonas putida ND6 TaxID=231023 RepID=I3UZD3_PSEPU|nr:hypothetical protein YSA_07567 [Pseudomonas putida ND6]
MNQFNIIKKSYKARSHFPNMRNLMYNHTLLTQVFDIIIKMTNFRNIIQKTRSIYYHLNIHNNLP